MIIIEYKDVTHLMNAYHFCRATRFPLIFHALSPVQVLKP
jgi:hypothetical protein